MACPLKSPYCSPKQRLDPQSVASAMPKVVAATKNFDIANRAKVLITRSKSK